MGDEGGGVGVSDMQFSQQVTESLSQERFYNNGCKLQHKKETKQQKKKRAGILSGAAVITFLSELWNFTVVLVQSGPGRLEETRKWHKTCWSSAGRSWVLFMLQTEFTFPIGSLCADQHICRTTQVIQQICLNLENWVKFILSFHAMTSHWFFYRRPASQHPGGGDRTVEGMTHLSVTPSRNISW